MQDINKYIDEWFINLSLKNIPPSFFVIRKSILKAVDELKPDVKGVVLDLGCGVMPYRDYLKNTSVDNYIGIDLEPTLYHHIVKPDLYWDGVNIPLGDSSCDYVIATEFFEHYFDIDHILKEVKRVLKKDGKLFFTVPSIWPIHEAPYDFYRFTPFFLDEIFKKNEFTSWEIKSLGGFNTCISLILSFWFEKKSLKVQWLLKPFFIKLLTSLIKREKNVLPLENSHFYSGLYGFVVK